MREWVSIILIPRLLKQTGLPNETGKGISLFRQEDSGVACLRALDLAYILPEVFANLFE